MAFWWSDENVERLRAMALDGASASQIAAAIHAKTRNVVIGKARRLGVKFGSRQGPDPSIPVLTDPPLQPKETRAPPQPAVPALRPITETRNMRQPRGVVAAPREGAHRPSGIVHYCCWLVPDRREENGFRYCGEDAPTPPYCAKHSKASRT